MFHGGLYHVIVEFPMQFSNFKFLTLNRVKIKRWTFFHFSWVTIGVFDLTYLIRKFLVISCIVKAEKRFNLSKKNFWSRTLTFQKNCFTCCSESLFIMMKNTFLFHLKSSFGSEGMQFFVLTFWSYGKNGFIRNIRLVSKFMTSQPG